MCVVVVHSALRGARRPRGFSSSSVLSYRRRGLSNLQPHYRPALMLCVPSRHSASPAPPPKLLRFPPLFSARKAAVLVLHLCHCACPCCVRLYLHGGMDPSRPLLLLLISQCLPIVEATTRTPASVKQDRQMAGAVAPVPVARHVVAVVLVLAAHGVLCGSSSSHHVEFGGAGVARGRGNAPLSRTRGNGTDDPAGGPAPAPSSASLVGCGCGPTPPARQFKNEMLATLYPVIQEFKKTITCDPKNVTASWEGTELCDSFFNGTKYQGFYCDYLPNTPVGDINFLTVASIDFNGYGLCAPSLGGFVDKFPDLALFHANSNNFSGDVPDLSHLPYFYELDLSNNNFSGSFPDSVVPLGNLTFLDIRFNRYAGTVPAAVFALTAEALFLNNNGFYGRIPDSFGSTGAKYLVVANNEFTGPIPRSIYNTSATLSEVLFLNNRLSGCLPYEVGLVEGLVVFDAGGNEITGPIPLSFGCLRDVEELNLAGNQLYGRVPDVVCLLAKTGKLLNLSLSDNFFHSVGHQCMELVRSGLLDVRRNCILGFPNQRPPIECAAFYADPTKHCPFIPHIPCDLPGHGGYKPHDAAAAVAGAAGQGGGGD